MWLDCCGNRREIGCYGGQQPDRLLGCVGRYVYDEWMAAFRLSIEAVIIYLAV